jgi:hypothetical protein
LNTGFSKPGIQIKPLENNFRMDIYKHKVTLLRWISSCQTAQQLDLFARLVAESDASDKIEAFETELVKTELSDAIVERRIIIAGKKEPMRVTSDWLLIPNERAILLYE